MSENSEHNAGESNENHVAKPELNAEGINRGRRALARAVLVGTPVILTLASKPSLALDKMATVSGQLSGNLSQANAGGAGGSAVGHGYTTSYWSQQPASGNSYKLYCNGVELKKNSEFKKFFTKSTEKITLQDALKTGQDRIPAQLVAALLNACIPTLGYGYTSNQVIELHDNYFLAGSTSEKSALLEALQFLNSL